ncbi:MAG: HAD family hydrolase [Candidatus Hodarchaeota archaeon]
MDLKRKRIPKLISLDFWNTLYFHIGTKEFRLKTIDTVIKEFCIQNLDLDIDLIEYIGSNFFQVLSNRIKSEWKEGRCPNRSETSQHCINFFHPYLDKENCIAIIKLIENLYINKLRLRMVKNGFGFVKWAYNEGFHLSIISDTFVIPARILREIMKQDKILNYFDRTLFSDETCKMKPDSREFLKMMNNFKINPSSVVHIGDLIETDGVLAMNAGVNFILFQTSSYSIVNEEFQEVPIAARFNEFEKLPEIINGII